MPAEAYCWALEHADPKELAAATVAATGPCRMTIAETGDPEANLAWIKRRAAANDRRLRQKAEAEKAAKASQ